MRLVMANGIVIPSAIPNYIDWRNMDERVIFPVDDLAAAIPDRKRVLHGASSDLPAELGELSAIVSGLVQQPFNTAIIKRSRPDDTYKSAAYEWHTDPDCYAGKIALVSLSGRARLDVRLGTHRSGIETRSLYCYGGRVVMFGARAEHRTSPALSQQEHRFVFLGFDVTREQ